VTSQVDILPAGLLALLLKCMKHIDRIVQRGFAIMCALYNFLYIWQVQNPANPEMEDDQAKR
jgi:hypothetical protein